METLQNPGKERKVVIRFGLLCLMLIYLYSSWFSFIELNELSSMLSSDHTRTRLLVMFAVSVLLPVFLVFIDDTVNVRWIRILIEFISPVIIVVFYYLSCKEPWFSNRACADIFSILVSDIISSFVLLVFHKMRKS